MKYLIVCKGWIGDTLFASSIAERLKRREPNCYVAFWIPLVQPRLLLEQNPFIDEVIFGDEGTLTRFDHIFEMPVLRQDIPATHQYQRVAGIDDPTLPFDVYTVPKYDEMAAAQLHRSKNRPIVTYQGNWDWKSKLYTPDQYERGDTAALRNINMILNKISQDADLICIGFPEHIHQRHQQAHNAELFAGSASVIKHSDFFIGAEGGLSNLACAVGTKTIITTDHNWAMFGPRGLMAQFDTLAMGPATYYPDAGHVHLDPYLTDLEVAQSIIHLIHA